MAPTRRVVLGAAVGAVLLAGCSSGAVEERAGSLRSSHLPGRDVPWRLALPRDVPSPPLVVVLHGRGGDVDSAFDLLHLQDHVERTGLALASVSGGVDYWHRRRSGRDAGAMVVDDLLPLLARETGYAGRVAFLGWSMGGYGSLLLASRLGPGRVGAVVAESAALWTDPADSAPGAFDDRADFVAHDVFAAPRLRVLSRVPVRLDCGRDDAFVEANRAFGAALPSAELTVDDGGHTTAYWRDHGGPQLDWVARHLQATGG
jgi:pimeloyl-ACP methyl ester carboxylesterase